MLAMSPRKKEKRNYLNEPLEMRISKESKEELGSIISSKGGSFIPDFGCHPMSFEENKKVTLGSLFSSLE